VRPQVAKIFLHGFAFLTVFALGVLDAQVRNQKCPHR